MQKQIEIVINNETFILKQSFRSYMLYEELTGKQIGDIVTIKDILNLLFCTLSGCNKHWKYNFDQFVDLVDEQPELLAKFNEFNTGLLTEEKKNQTDQV